MNDEANIIRVEHQPTGAVIAEGPRGWGMFGFEGNLYVRRAFLQEGNFRVNYVPGFCPYKFLYVWLDFIAPNGQASKNLGWLYWLPNPLFPWIWYRVAVPMRHPEIRIVRPQLKEDDKRG